jgi:hypothetical protein
VVVRIGTVLAAVNPETDRIAECAEHLWQLSVVAPDWTCGTWLPLHVSRQSLVDEEIENVL